MSRLRISDALRRLLQGDSGQDLLEYALLASLIAIGVMGAVDTIGGTIKSIFWDAIANAKF